MNSNEQQAQRDKLIELAEAWNEKSLDCIYSENQFRFEIRSMAEQAFRDYVEHMHDEPAKPSAIRCIQCSWIDFELYKHCEDCSRKLAQRMKGAANQNEHMHDEVKT